MKIKLLTALFVLLAAILSVAFFAVYIPKSPGASALVVYDVEKGTGSGEIAKDLKEKGIIKNSLFFKLYAIISGQHSNLQAGKYDLSPSMAIASIVGKLASGDVIKNQVTILEGWNLEDIGQHLEDKGLYSKKDFLYLAENYWSQDFDFLKDKPVNLSLEGYIFPDTYEITLEDKTEDFLKKILTNFDKKLSGNLRSEIELQRKSVFQIITMASIIEKEVRTTEDKRIVSGILWKRIENGVPLQVDSTINYITGKNDASVAIKDTKIDSPYNTYRYYGLPKGPISNPGIDSIMAAIYPVSSSYWYYLSANGNGETIFSQTLEDHNVAKAKYLN